MSTSKGTWRFDIVIMILYQITLVFSAQLVFVIFLDYMPSSYCTDDHFCYRMRSKCLTDFDRREDLNMCPATLGNKRRSCIVDAKKLFFYSAQFEFQQDCTGLKAFGLSTATFIGTLLGNIVLGFLADKYGRRTVYFFSILFGIPSLVLSAVIHDVVAFYVFRVLTGFAVAGTLTVGWTYATEMISPSKRLRLLALANWPNARMIQVGFAYLAKEWRRTTYLSASFTCLALPVLWYLPESPIWLEQKDMYEEASRARKRIQRINGGGVDELHDPIEVVTFEKVTPARVFKNPKLRTSFIVIVFMYFYVGMAVYITDLNGADMTRNLYWGQFLTGLVLSVGQFIIGMSEPCLTGMGRRVLFLVSQLVAIICYVTIVVCLYVRAKGSFIYIFAYTIAYASQSICLESAYLALVELMPTDVRASVGAVANTAMKIGTVVATLTKPIKFAYEPSLFFINLALGIVGIVVVFFFLEESREADMKMVGQKPTGTVTIYDEMEEKAGEQEEKEGEKKEEKSPSDEKEKAKEEEKQTNPSPNPSPIPSPVAPETPEEPAKPATTPENERMVSEKSVQKTPQAVVRVNSAEKTAQAETKAGTARRIEENTRNAPRSQAAASSFDNVSN